MYETLFILSYQLCKEFPALSPYELDYRPYGSVIELYADVRRLQLRKKREEKKNDPDRIIRRPAGDNWF